MKNILREIIPPILWRSLSRLRRAMRTVATQGQRFEYGVEQPAEFYDRSYEERTHWDKHYTDSHYYPLWTVIADRIRRAGVKRILDVGCGPGQIACLVRDIGVPEYKGLDFSTARVAKARAVCPEYEFVAANVFEDNLLETYHYDCVLMMELLEHIEQDVNVLKRVRPGTTVFATVPNFPAVDHVRHFDSVNDVEVRYSPVFSKLEVDAILAKNRGNIFYILQGTR
jgi:2-polyprenyl-3-methyl-5-hydroxy-6-metoxy-1,4-benzoquinol methylase